MDTRQQEMSKIDSSTIHHNINKQKSLGCQNVNAI